MKSLFTPQNSAILLIDHQQGTIKLAQNIANETVVAHTRALARTAVECGMPLILTTSMEENFQGPLFDDFKTISPDAYERRIKRPGTVDCWMYDEYRSAVEQTGKKKLIMAGLTNDVCIVYPSISAVEAGFEVQVVVDAGGSPSQVADEVAMRRMEKHGVELTTTNQVMAELATDWSSELGGKIQGIMYEEILKPLVEK